MKMHTCNQGSQEWLDLRIGIPTASEFERIVTPTGKLSKSSHAYALRLAAERLLNTSTESISSLEWIARGKELEPEAARLYEFQNDVATRPVGFITTDDGRIGCSPDRLVIDEPGAVEIKCPAPQTHLGYMLDGFGPDYIPQVQGQMLVVELEWVDRWSWHPEMPPVCQRTYRDEAYIKLLSAALTEFCDNLDVLVERAQAMGFFKRRRRAAGPVDAEYAEPAAAEWEWAP